MNAIGIDLGTTGICGIAIDTGDGKILKSRTESSNAFLPGCAPWERIQSAEKILSIASDILDSLIDDNTVSIGITGQMHGIVYINKDGNAVSPLYTWQDGRGNLPYKDTTYAQFLGSFSGYGCVTDFYNKENGLRPREAAALCTVQDYFVMRLCGLKGPVMHASNASSLGTYDLMAHRLAYDPSIQIATDYRIAGTHRGIPVSIAIGDNQASVFSTLAADDGILLNVGTGSQISILCDAPIEGDGIETRPYFDGKYLAVGAALCGGRAYSLLKDFYASVLGYVKETDSAEVYAVMARMLERAEESALRVDTRFAGTRSEPSARGGIYNVGTENFTPENLTAGFLSGMADELFTLFEKMNVPRRGIVGSGNGIRKNAALVRIFERRFGARMRIPAHLEEAAYGAALYALIGCGILKNAEDARALIRYL